MNKDLEYKVKRLDRLLKLCYDKDDIIKRLQSLRDDLTERIQRQKNSFNDRRLINENKNLKDEIFFLKERLTTIEEENEIRNSEPSSKSPEYVYDYKKNDRKRVKTNK